LDRTLIALADPTRRRLLDRVSRGPTRASDLGRGLPMSRPAVSKHLRILRQAGLITAVPQGREIMYRVPARVDCLREVRDYVEQVGRTWDRALAAFKACAEQEEGA